MGLDLVVGACAKPGHEDEWRRILEHDFAEELTEAEVARFPEISIPPYERIEAPRVGFDEAANAWIIEVKKATTPEQAAEVLKAFHGYRALWLVKCDGISRYSSSRVSDAVDETSFCGEFLNDCPDVLESGLLKTASSDMWPAEAVAYGEALLAAANRAEGGTEPVAIKGVRWLLDTAGLNKTKSPDTTLEQQLDIVRAAGRWYVFWGERGHYIRASF
ncbi:MAG TPA: hypothetical protein VGJ56_32765 [Reyranella sp.]|jgi:hypothetical protein